MLRKVVLENCAMTRFTSNWYKKNVMCDKPVVNYYQPKTA